jgi:hypothetical protein
MAGFERLVSGKSTKEPSFADRAKSRWATQMGESPS